MQQYYFQGQGAHNNYVHNNYVHCNRIEDAEFSLSHDIMYVANKCSRRFYKIFPVNKSERSIKKPVGDGVFNALMELMLAYLLASDS